MLRGFQPARGYILLEITIGGALIALLIASLLTQVAQARVDNVIAGREIVASQLLQEKIERERARGFVAGGSCSPAETNTVVAGQQGTYRRTCVRDAAATQTIGSGPAVTVNYNDVKVTVTYDTNKGPRDLEAYTRVYER